MKVSIIYSRFNPEITSRLLEGAKKALKDKGIEERDIEIIDVPGAYEIPIVMEALCAKINRPDAVVLLGCIIKGETAHFEYVSGPVSDSIVRISYENMMPCGFGVLTTYNDEQAEQRSQLPPDSENNKGYEAALVAIEMYEKINNI